MLHVVIFCFCSTNELLFLFPSCCFYPDLDCPTATSSTTPETVEHAHEQSPSPQARSVQVCRQRSTSGSGQNHLNVHHARLPACLSESSGAGRCAYCLPLTSVTGRRVSHGATSDVSRLANGD